MTESCTVSTMTDARAAELGISALISEARLLTGKPPTENDALLLAYLDAQEIHSASDFLHLSDASFAQITRQPCVTLVMADTLRRLRRDQPDGTSGPSKSEPKPPAAPPSALHRRVSNPPPLETLATTVIHGLIGTITMTHNQKRNALGLQLCSEIARGLERCTAAGVRAIILRAQPGVTVCSARCPGLEVGLGLGPNPNQPGMS